MEIKNYKNIIELEFELLEEVVIEQELYDNSNVLSNIIGKDVYKVVKLTDDYMIGNNNNFNRGRFCLIKGNFNNFKEGDFCCWCGDIIKKINVEVFDDEFISDIEELKNKNKLYYTEKVDIFKIDEFEITQEIILNLYRGIIDENNKRIEEEEKLRVIERETKEHRERRRKKKYENEGIFKNDKLDIDKKIIIDNTNYQKNKFILKKDVNKVFDYETINQKYHYDNTKLGFIENFLINKKVSYEKLGGHNKKLKYKVEFDGVKLKVNGVKVLSNKLNFILNRTDNDMGKEKIKQLNKMSGMNVDFLNLKSIRCNGLEIPISVRFDDNLFEIEFIHHKKSFDWEDIREMFFDGGKQRSVSNYMSNNKMLLLCNRMNIPKQKLFSYLQKLELVDSL